jgi:hypothetical protein
MVVEQDWDSHFDALCRARPGRVVTVGDVQYELLGLVTTEIEHHDRIFAIRKMGSTTVELKHFSWLEFFSRGE